MSLWSVDETDRILVKIDGFERIHRHTPCMVLTSGYLRCTMTAAPWIQGLSSIYLR